MKKQGVSRRHFVAGAGTLFAMPTIISSGCLSLRGGGHRPPPSERVNVGILGYGTMAQDNIGNFLNNDRVQVISGCDPVSEGPLYGYKAERVGGARTRPSESERVLRREEWECPL